VGGVGLVFLPKLLFVVFVGNVGGVVVVGTCGWGWNAWVVVIPYSSLSYLTYRW